MRVNRVIHSEQGLRQLKDEIKTFGNDVAFVLSARRLRSMDETLGSTGTA